MSRRRGKARAGLLVLLTGVVVVSAIAAVGATALDRKQAATQSGPDADVPTSGERMDNDATNRSSHTTDASWNMARANAANTKYINTTGPTNPITTRWTFATDANTFSAGPVVANGTVYFGTLYYAAEDKGKENFYAVDSWTGEQRWTFQPPTGSTINKVAVLRDTVYIGSSNGRLYALDAATGDEYWNFVTDGKLKGLTIANRTLYVASRGSSPGLTVPDGHVYALGALRGEEKWQITTDGPTTGVAVKDGTTYVTTWHGSRVYALDAETGAEQWNVQLNGWLRSPSVANGMVYVGTHVDGEDVYALDTETGNQQWKRTIGGADGIASPAVLRNTAYFSGNHLHAVKAMTGADRWSKQSLRGTPVLLNDVGYIRGGDTLYTLDPETGAHHARFSAANARFTQQHSNAHFRAGIAVLNGSLYTGYGFDEPRTSSPTDHTAFYALGTPEFTSSNLSVTPGAPDLNESVTATVTVRNTGTGPGEYNATLVVNGNATNATTARLDPRTSRTVTFAHTFAENGTYTVELGGLTRRLTVGDVEPAPTPTPTSAGGTGSPTQTGASEETATSGGSDSTPPDAVTPTATSGSAPGFGVTGWVAAVALVAVLVGILKRD